MVTNMVLNIILMFPLAHAGLALATSISATLNAGLLFRGLRKQNIYQPSAGWGMLGLRAALATLIMAGVLLVGAGSLGDWLAWESWQRIWRIVG